MFNNENLTACVENVPRLLGCEAAYFFPAGVDICPPAKSTLRAGHLVVHVRSGDIFNGMVRESTIRRYGQVREP